MFVRYNSESGEITGAIKSPQKPSGIPDPLIEISSDFSLENKRVDTKSEQIVWDYTLTEAQSDKIQEIKDRAYEVLEETDWYVVREQETGETIPQDVLDHRSQVRSDSDSFEQDVNGLETVEDVLNYGYSFPKPPKR